MFLLIEELDPAPFLLAGRTIPVGAGGAEQLITGVEVWTLGGASLLVVAPLIDRILHLHEPVLLSRILLASTVDFRDIQLTAHCPDS